MNTENKNNNQVPVTGNTVVNNNFPNTGGGQPVAYQAYPSTVPEQKTVVPGTVGGSSQAIPNTLQQPVIGVAPVRQTVVSPTNVIEGNGQQNVQSSPVGQGAFVVSNPTSSPTTVVLGTQQQGSGEVPAAPVPPKAIDNTEVLNNENPNGQHEVVEILSSSFEQKNKVNLLTPEQKEALTKKREEALKEKESYQPKPVSKFKRVMSVMVFVMLFGIVFFLPEISSYLAEVREPSEGVDNTPITTGTLKCSLDKVDDKYNLSYSYDFDFTDSKLDRLNYVQATSGDELVDYDDLNQKLTSCDHLKTVTAGLAGIKITCSLSSGVLTEEQTFNYNVLNHEQVSATYIEAGGLFPEFESNTDIDMIEKNMKAAGYTCERVK